MFGRIHSFQSLGTLDGPGVRTVVFMQGCPLRCVCCHNPDTWNVNAGLLCESEEIMKKVLRCKNYFGQNGGLTISGGEPLMQSDFVGELFELAHKNGIHTALDTSGCVLNDSVKRLLEHTDLVILDYKYTDADLYVTKTKCEKAKVDAFLKYLNEIKKDVWIRQVIIPALNDNAQSVKKLAELKNRYDCVKKIELLAFRKLCVEKYNSLKIDFPLADTPETTPEKISELSALLN